MFSVQFLKLFSILEIFFQTFHFLSPLTLRGPAYRHAAMTGGGLIGPPLPNFFIFEPFPKIFLQLDRRRSPLSIDVSKSSLAYTEPEIQPDEEFWPEPSFRPKPQQLRFLLYEMSRDARAILS